MPDPLRIQALKLLTRRDFCRAELKSRLAPQAESPDQLEVLLDNLQAQHLLSDHRYACQRVVARAGRYGNARLKQELRAKGVGDEDIAVALPEGGDEAVRCKAVRQKKFGTLPGTAEERARQMRFLQYRGFSSAAIRAALAGDED